MGVRGPVRVIVGASYLFWVNCVSINNENKSTARGRDGMVLYLGKWARTGVSRFSDMSFAHALVLPTRDEVLLVSSCCMQWRAAFFFFFFLSCLSSFPFPSQAVPDPWTLISRIIANAGQANQSLEIFFRRRTGSFAPSLFQPTIAGWFLNFFSVLCHASADPPAYLRPPGHRQLLN